MKKVYTAYQRKRVYLKIARLISENITDVKYVCNELNKEVKYVFNIQSAFPEFELFRPIINEYGGNAWFSESNVEEKSWGKQNQLEGNIARINALLFCAAMCNNETKS